jgi:hypothetical protein
MLPTRKMQAAGKLLEQWFHSGLYPGKQCVAILDVLRYPLTENPIAALMELPGLRSLRSTRITRPADSRDFQGYGRAHWFQRDKSKMKVSVESEPREKWLDPFAVTMFADDRTGLLPEDIFPILELMPTARLTLIELAFDFSFASGVTRRYVRARAVFGKSHRDRSGSNPNVDCWGIRRSGKRVKSYHKAEVAGHRVEFRMRPKFLHPHDIHDVFDFWRFAELLPGKHLLFARVDEQKLTAQLQRNKRRKKNANDILQKAKALDGDLTAQLTFLRRAARLKNVRRLLVPLKANRLVREALKEWVATWPKAPTHLEQRK